VHALRQRFEILPLSEAVTRLRQGPLPRPTAVLTFDDGFQDAHDVVLPILRQAGLPATLFLPTALLDTSDTIWFCRLNRALARARADTLAWNGARLSLASPQDRARAAVVLKAQLKALPHPRLLAELRRLVLALGDDPDAPIAPDSPYRLLDRPALAALVASGLVELGAHTESHAILSLLSPAEQQREIAPSLARVAALSGAPCTLFAYPNGERRDYDRESLRLLHASGVRAAVTAIGGLNHPDTPPLELRRCSVGPAWSLDQFVAATRHGGPPPRR